LTNVKIFVTDLNLIPRTNSKMIIIFSNRPMIIDYAILSEMVRSFSARITEKGVKNKYYPYRITKLNFVYTYFT